MRDGLHASLDAIQTMESASVRLGSVVADRLPDVTREMRQVQESLDERQDDLRSEISHLQSEIDSSDEDDNVSWAQDRMEEAKRELALVRISINHFGDVVAAYAAQANLVNQLATDHTVRARTFLRGAAEDLRAYFAKTLDGGSPQTGAGLSSSGGGASMGPLAGQTPPVSKAITIEVIDSTGAASIVEALAAIDQVHLDGALPRVAVRELRDSNIRGLFQSVDTEGPQGQVADHLAVCSSSPWPALTMVHETGHFLDLEGIGSKGSFATASRDPLMVDVLRTAKDTAAIRSLEAARSHAGSVDEKEYLNYLLLDAEIWARAYAQFIAERSESGVLKQQLEMARSDEPDHQWMQGDFAKLGEAIHAMFTRLGWL